MEFHDKRARGVTDSALQMQDAEAMAKQAA